MFGLKILSKKIAQKSQQNLTKKPRVKLVAIAKDEGAYFVQWIHHHFYFGFDAIDVYLNRTTDNSEQVLLTLQKLYPDLTYRYADWIDNCPKDAAHFLQFIVYAKALEDNRISGEFDYLMFLDIDEFWTPTDMQTSIQDCLQAYPNAHSISFGWLNEHGNEQPFSPLSEHIKGQLSPLVKTAIRHDANILEIGLHRSELRDGHACMVDGDTFVSSADNRECLHADLIRVRSVMIVHRMFRSEFEYVSLLYRGRPSDDLPLKLNRRGYNKALGEHCNLALDPHEFTRYRESMLQCLDQPDIKQQLLQAESFVKHRYQLTLEAVRLMSIDYIPQLFSVFKGCKKEILETISASIRESKELEECTNPEKLIGIASKIQKVDAKLAQFLVAKAMAI